MELKGKRGNLGRLRSSEAVETDKGLDQDIRNALVTQGREDWEARQAERKRVTLPKLKFLEN